MRTVGVEIEVVGISNPLLLKYAIMKHGIPVKIMKKRYRFVNRWYIVRDGSLNSGGFELVSPKMIPATMKSKLAIITKAVKNAGAKVDESCGFHVHCGACDLKCKDLDLLLELYKAKEKQIDSVVDASRKDNQYCKSVAVATSADLRKDKNYQITFTSLRTNNTVEFRQHQGTLDIKEMEEWINFTVGIVEAAKAKAKAEDVDMSSYFPVKIKG